MAIKEAVVVGVFSIISAFTGAYIQKYGLNFFDLKKQLYTGNGVGSDISLSKINSDFTSRQNFEYVFKNCKLETEGNKVDVECQVVSKDPRKIEHHGVIKGEGISKDGMAYIIYWGEYPLDQVKWPGVLVIRLLRLGNLKGYWLSEDTLTKGKFSLGYIDITR